MAEYKIIIPRLRMFAGPNGSGKSTLKSVIVEDLLGVYINPDEIEEEIKQFDFLDLQRYGVDAEKDEIELLQAAQLMGYRTYLYYIATDDPEINITRVKQRVAQGGHDVPQDKIVSRYQRSSNQLSQAIKATNRAYIFDNSGDASILVCEVTDGNDIDYKQDLVPDWVYRHVGERCHRD